MLTVERTVIYGTSYMLLNPHIERPIKGETRYLYILYSNRLNTCNLYEYMLQCDRSKETYTRNILQFNIENIPGLVDSIFKIHLDIRYISCMGSANWSTTYSDIEFHFLIHDGNFTPPIYPKNE